MSREAQVLLAIQASLGLMDRLQPVVIRVSLERAVTAVFLAQAGTLDLVGQADIQASQGQVVILVIAELVQVGFLVSQVEADIQDIQDLMVSHRPLGTQDFLGSQVIQDSRVTIPAHLDIQGTVVNQGTPGFQVLVV